MVDIYPFIFSSVFQNASHAEINFVLKLLYIESSIGCIKTRAATSNSYSFLLFLGIK